MIERRCWTFAEIFALGVFWGEIPCRRIGELIGHNKNEVISKARRLGLGKFEEAMIADIRQELAS